jgi:hypothetical protein
MNAAAVWVRAHRLHFSGFADGASTTAAPGIPY